MNSNKVLNPNESKVKMIWTEFWIRIDPNNINLGFIMIEKLVRIHSDSKSRINSDWLELSWIDFQPICIKRDWKLFTDWLGWLRISLDTDFAMNRSNSDWFEMNLNPELLPGQSYTEKSRDSVNNFAVRLGKILFHNTIPFQKT